MFNLPASYVGTAAQNQELLQSLLYNIKRPQQVSAGQPQVNLASVAGVSGFVAETPDWLKSKIALIAQKYNLSTNLISAQLSNESIRFNEDVIYGRGKWAKGNVAGAAGIAQFIPSTARSYGLRVEGGIDDRLNVDKALDAYGRMMSDLMKRYGSVEKALSAYNSGDPNKYKNPTYRTSYGSVGETYKYVRDIIKRSNVVEKPKILAQEEDAFSKAFKQRKIVEGLSKESSAASSAQLKQMQVKDAVQNVFNKEMQKEQQQYPASVNQQLATKETDPYKYGVPMPPIYSPTFG